MTWQVAACLLLVASVHASCNNCTGGEDGGALLQTKAKIEFSGEKEAENKGGVLMEPNAAAPDYAYHRGLNCYGGRGANALPGMDMIGKMSLEQCKEACRNQLDCEGIVVLHRQLHGNCYLRKDIVPAECNADAAFDLWLQAQPSAAAPDYAYYRGLNCYGGRGANALPGMDMIGKMRLEQCKEACRNQLDCEGIVVLHHRQLHGNCYLRKDIVPAECNADAAFDLWLQAPQYSYAHHPGLNCYGGQGANGLVGDYIANRADPLPGEMDLVQCKGACSSEPTCEGIVVFGATCYLRKDIRINECRADQHANLWLRMSDYIYYRGLNCYGGQGANSLPGADMIGKMSQEQCKIACRNKPGCEGIVVHRGQFHSDCYLRKDVRTHQCIGNTDMDLWLRKSSMFVYEMDVLHFRKDFGGAKQRLQGLRDDLGINVIWVMSPYQRFADGPYATKNYFEIDRRLGTKEDARAFVREAHRLGMKVWFDITTVGHGCDAMSHDVRLLPSRDQQITKAEVAFSSWPDLCAFKYDSEPEKVTNFFRDVFSYWVRELDIDGYRCDTASGFSFVYHLPELERRFWTMVISSTKHEKPGTFFLAEGFDTALYDYGFDAIYAASLVTGWGDPQKHRLKILVDAMYSPSLYPKLQSEITQSLNMVPHGKAMMFYTTNHDLWLYDHDPLTHFGNKTGSMRAFLVCLFSSGMLQVYNGQEIGTHQTLNFNNADHMHDIKWALRDSTLVEFYKRAGQLFKEFADLFTYGQYEWRMGQDTFGLVRALNRRKVGLFLGSNTDWSDLHNIWPQGEQLGFRVMATPNV